MRKTEKRVRIVFAGFSLNKTEKLIRKMSGKLKLQSTASVFLPEEHCDHDRIVCHSCFFNDTQGVITGEYFMGGTADMIYAASDADAVRNISWLKTEGTVIIENNDGKMKADQNTGDEPREFLKKQEEYGFVRTFIH